MTSALIFNHRKINPSARITKHSTSKYANTPLYSSDTTVQLAIRDMPAYHSECILEYRFNFILGLVLIIEHHGYFAFLEIKILLRTLKKFKYRRKAVLLP